MNELFDLTYDELILKLQSNDNFVSYEEFCDLVNHFFFKEVDIFNIISYRNNITISNKVSYLLYKPKNTKVTGSVETLNHNYDILLKYNLVLDLSKLLSSWDVPPSYFGFLEHIVNNPPEIAPNFSDWVLNTDYKSEAIKFLYENDIKLSYYNTNNNTFRSLERLTDKYCKLFISLLDNVNLYSAYLLHMSNFKNILEIREDKNLLKNYLRDKSHNFELVWYLDPNFCCVYDNYDYNRCINNHFVKTQYRLVNPITNEYIPLCDKCITDLNIPKYNDTFDLINQMKLISDIDMSTSNKINFINKNINKFKNLEGIIKLYDISVPYNIEDFTSNVNKINTQEEVNLIYDEMQAIIQTFFNLRRNIELNSKPIKVKF